MREGNVRRAKEHLQHIWEKDPADIPSAILYSIALSLTKEDDKAEAVLEYILNTDVGHMEKASAYYQKAILQQKKGDLEGAADSYTEALKADPAHTNSMKELALIYMETGRQDEGLAMMKSRLSVLVNEETLNDVGVIYWLLGQKEEAYKWFASALENNPFYKSAILNIAAAGEEIGRVSEAREYVLKFLTYHPEDADLRGLLTNLGQGVKV
ncbi:MAG: tetratricopeptide repeat protein [Nitrospirae bacterium]|nr:tetratricopeptide repeat protein [Nitrospirota bacterium]